MIIRFAFLAAAAAIMVWSVTALAASAVAINPQSNKYSWTTEATIDDAEAKALAACEKLSGSGCRILSTCGLPGEGAIAFNKATGAWGTVCGAKDAAAADAYALENCNLRSEASNKCAVIERFTDKHLGETVAQGYFAGKWSENCKSDAWHTFTFVNAVEFRINNCTADGCKDGREVFRPMLGESVFHWPTDNTRLKKRGHDTMEMTKVNSTFLDRCGG